MQIDSGHRSPFIKVTVNGETVVKIKRGGVLVATTMTLDQLTALMENEPAAGSKTRTITLERIANVDKIVADAATILDVSDEVKSDGTAYPLATILSAYRKIVKDRELGESVNVTEYKTAGKVVLSGNVVNDDDDDTTDEGDDN